MIVAPSLLGQYIMIVKKLVFNDIKKARITLIYDKIFLAVKKRVVLGYVVLEKGRKSDSKKVKAIVKLNHPLIIKEV